VVSHVAVAVPMCLLYEVGIFGARYFASGKKTEKEESADSSASS